MNSWLWFIEKRLLNALLMGLLTFVVAFLQIATAQSTADAIVTHDPHKIDTTQVLLTMVGGKVVYQSDNWNGSSQGGK